jgi:transcription elongation factor Elf1
MELLEAFDCSECGSDSAIISLHCNNGNYAESCPACGYFYKVVDGDITYRPSIVVVE